MMRLDESDKDDECILIDVDVGGTFKLNKAAAIYVLATLAASEADVGIEVSAVTVGD